MTLPHDYARCPGFGDGPEDWLDECHDCQRRTADAGLPFAALDELQFMKPPSIITFVCEYQIPPDQPEDQRLRDLAKEQGVSL